MQNQEDPFRVLVVDDVEDNRELLSRRLERKGYLTVAAESGIAALELIAKQEFDLVLLDIMMPNLNGVEVLERIRRSRSADALPVIMVTAKAGTTDIVEALQRGANDYIPSRSSFRSPLPAYKPSSIASEHGRRSMRRCGSFRLQIND